MSRPGTWASLLMLFLIARTSMAQVPDSHRDRWLKLMHYRSGWFGYESAIDFAGYFFSDRGKTDPEGEWQASLDALAKGQPLAGGEAPNCAFPARFRLMRSFLPEGTREPDCERFGVWRDRLKLESISLVFSTAYSGNPASLLGHTFLKLNLKSDGPRRKSHLLHYGASFAAAPEDEVGFLYFVKGLTGGYRGVFSLEPYYEHVMAYSYGENRDLWEYEIDLSGDELEIFLAHFWELYAHAHVDYYFLDDNCSSLLLEVLDAIRPELNLAARRGWIVLPHQTVRVLTTTLTPRAVRFYPSQRRQFRAHVGRLTKHERGELKRLIARETVPARVEGANVLESALAFANLTKSQLKADKQVELRAWEREILVARAARPSAHEPPEIAEPPNRPDLAPGAKKVAIGYAFGAVSGVAARARLGLHDKLDPIPGFDSYYHMNFLDLSGVITREGIGQGRLVAAEVTSIAPMTEFEKKVSWRAGGGLRTLNTSPCRSCGGAYGEGGVGVAWELIPDRFLIDTMPGVEVDINAHLPNRVAGRVVWDLAAWIYWNETHRSHVNARLATNVLHNSVSGAYGSVRLAHSVSMTSNLLLELSGEGERAAMHWYAGLALIM